MLFLNQKIVTIIPSEMRFTLPHIRSISLFVQPPRLTKSFIFLTSPGNTHVTSPILSSLYGNGHHYINKPVPLHYCDFKHSKNKFKSDKLVLFAYQISPTCDEVYLVTGLALILVTLIVCLRC